MDEYIENYKSIHWSKKYLKTINNYNINKLSDFRKNGLSSGLDDKHDLEINQKNFSDLVHLTGFKFIEKFLLEQNIGNNDYYFKKDNYFVDSNNLFIIQWLYEIQHYLKNQNEKIFCEIGAGYGALACLLLKNYNIKYIIIDLPESLFLSAYYLMNNLKNKKICFYCDIKNKKISEVINEYDIFLLPPWYDFESKFKIDFFLNTRSFSEMNKSVIDKYFKFIHKNISRDGYFLNINRYQKNTVGEMIYFHNFQYDNFWSHLISKRTWKQKNIHFCFSKRSRNFKLDSLFLFIDTFIKNILISYSIKVNRFKKFLLELKN